MKNKIVVIIAAIVSAFLLFLFITVFIFIKVQVPTGSMYPTIQLNDKVFVLRDSVLRRGDLGVFYNDELGTMLIKRTIGLPGDRVEIISGEVFINGLPISEPYVVNRSYEDMEFEVPEEKYLFLGDNRSASVDARSWKEPYIDTSNVIGKAVFRFYPLSRIGGIG